MLLLRHNEARPTSAAKRSEAIIFPSDLAVPMLIMETQMAKLPKVKVAAAVPLPSRNDTQAIQPITRWTC